MIELEQRQIEFALTFGLTLKEYKQLASSLGTEDLISVLELLKAKKHKSRRRAQYAAYVTSWLANPLTLKPLTPRQLKEIVPTWPVRFQLPT